MWEHSAQAATLSHSVPGGSSSPPAQVSLPLCFLTSLLLLHLPPGRARAGFCWLWLRSHPTPAIEVSNRCPLCHWGQGTGTSLPCRSTPGLSTSFPSQGWQPGTRCPVPPAGTARPLVHAGGKWKCPAAGTRPPPHPSPRTGEGSSRVEPSPFLIPLSIIYDFGCDLLNPSLKQGAESVPGWRRLKTTAPAAGQEGGHPRGAP